VELASELPCWQPYKTMTSKQRALPNREILPAATSWGSSWRVAESAHTPVVLIVDEDLGFVWWLGQIFSQAGCQVVPTLSSDQTVSLARDLNLKVDVIVVNPELSGISELIQTLSATRRPKIVAIRNHDSNVRVALPAHATLERPSGWGPVSEKEWLESVRRLVKEVKLGQSNC
jgi:DNA-binding NtrC family response regulator